MAYDKNKWVERVASRMDICGSVTHLTRASDPLSDAEVLLKILRERKINGSTTQTGFVNGATPAACFIDAPLYSICENLHFEKLNDGKRYEPFGLMFPKDLIYAKGGRPVIYEKSDIAKEFLPPDQHWRIVSFDLSNSISYVDWTHEREWRVPNSFEFDLGKATILLPRGRRFREFVASCDKEEVNYLHEVMGVVTLGSVYE